MITSVPLAARLRAIFFPNPRLPPVIKAILCFVSIILCFNGAKMGRKRGRLFAKINTEFAKMKSNPPIRGKTRGNKRSVS